mgnify:CR=1 FL=1
MFWENFQVQCAKVQKSPATVVEELGLSNSMPTSWKNGSLPLMKNRKKIADYFGITVEELMGTKKEPAGEGELTEDMKEILEYAQKMGPDERKAFITLLKSNSKK